MTLWGGSFLRQTTSGETVSRCLTYSKHRSKISLLTDLMEDPLTPPPNSTTSREVPVQGRAPGYAHLERLTVTEKWVLVINRTQGVKVRIPIGQCSCHHIVDCPAGAQEATPCPAAPVAHPNPVAFDFDEAAMTDAARVIREVTKLKCRVCGKEFTEADLGLPALFIDLLGALAFFSSSGPRCAACSEAEKEEGVEGTAKGDTPVTDTCDSCFTCLDRPAWGQTNPTNLRMILCSTCGNKRCPHATDHLLPCTDSNEPGQPGSRYAGEA